MKQHREERIALATRIYELDGEVYRCLGSSLGRVFTGKRDATIEELARLMCSSEKSHYLRSELALISNMARTIQDKPTRARLMREYDSILQEVESLPTSFGRVDILDEQMASLNAASLSDRFGKGDHLVICIGRTYGSAGTDIAQFVMSFIGYSYVYGGASPKTGFDCSGLMYYCLTQYGYKMNRTADDQMKQGSAVSRDELIVGDLVFFGYGSYANHVGMYIGNGNFVHASTPTTGVRINSLNETYYNTRYIGARRIIG